MHKSDSNQPFFVTLAGLLRWYIYLLLDTPISSDKSVASTCSAEPLSLCLSQERRSMYKLDDSRVNLANRFQIKTRALSDQIRLALEEIGSYSP